MSDKKIVPKDPSKSPKVEADKSATDESRTTQRLAARMSPKVIV